MASDSCVLFCMARRVDGTIAYKITFLALLLFLLLMVTNLDDHSQPSLSLGNDPSHGASLKRQKISEPSSTRRACRDKKIIPTKADNAIHSSPPTGRRGGGNHFSRWDRVFNSSAHEVPSGPNPISNR